MSQPMDRACLEAALRLLGRRDHSRYELSYKLARRGFDENISGPVITECIRRGYLNEVDQARLLIDSLVRKGFGRRRIMEALFAKRFAAEIVESTTATLFEERDELSLCREALRKKTARSLKPLSSPLHKNRLSRFLLQRGFSETAVRRAVEEYYADGR